MDNLVDDFSKARAILTDILEKFPKDKVEDKLFGSWNLKEVVAHFTAWDRYFMQAIKLLKQKKVMPYWESVHSFNANAAKRVSRLDWKKVYQEFVKVGEAFVEEYKKLPSELAHKPLWEKRKYTPMHLLKINIDHYKNDQIKEIQKLLKKWKIK